MVSVVYSEPHGSGAGADGIRRSAQPRGVTVVASTPETSARSSTGTDGPNQQFVDSDPNPCGFLANLWIVQGIAMTAMVWLPCL
jgi:hypothetical protein